MIVYMFVQAVQMYLQIKSTTLDKKVHNSQHTFFIICITHPSKNFTKRSSHRKTNKPNFQKGENNNLVTPTFLK